MLTSGDSAYPPVRLQVDLTDSGFHLTWSLPPQISPTDVDLEVLDQVRSNGHWTENTGWTRVPIPAGATTTSFDNVVPRHRYRFRIRFRNGRWTQPVDRLFVDTTLPVLRVQTVGYGQIADRKKSYRDARVSLEPNGAGVNGLKSTAQIRGRGNTTWDAIVHKKSFQLKFDSKQSLMGMPAAKRWVLLANFYDRSQLRNWTAQEIASATGLTWTPESRWVELVFNGDYYGIYQLSEKIDVGKNKVDIDKLTSDIEGGEELTGGYLLEIDRNANKAAEHSGWTSETGYPVYIKRPKPGASNAAQRDYIRDHVTRFERALYADNFDDPADGFRRLLDVESFMDYWIVEELTLDTDAFHWSTFLYKQRGDPRLHFGPVWDYDRALGSPYSRLGPDPRGWFTIHPDIALEDGTRTWAYRMFQDRAFAEQAAHRWTQILPHLRKIPARLLEVAVPLEPAKANDLLRWTDETDGFAGFRYGDTWENDEPEFLAQWLTDRIDWMTAELDAIAAGEAAAEAVELDEP